MRCFDNIFDRFCGNPWDYGLEADEKENYVEELNYGLSNFNNFFSSFWNIFQFIDVMGWTGINYPVKFLMLILLIFK